VAVCQFRLSIILLAFVVLGCGPSVHAENLTIVAKEESKEVVEVVVQSGGQSSLGSGVWLNEDGYVATCLHVVSIESQKIIQVRSAVDSVVDLERGPIIAANFEIFDADVVASDPEHDLVILKVSKNPFKMPQHVLLSINGLEIGSHYEKANLEIKLPERGEEIVIGGYPLGLPYLVFQAGTVASIALINGTPKILLSMVNVCIALDAVFPIRRPFAH
jgi:S1-C subfamily serine protease